MGRGSFNGSSAPAYDSDAAAWFTAVASAGGTITSANKTAFNTAIVAMKAPLSYATSDSIWNHIVLGGFTIGVSNLAGALVPFRNTASSTLMNNGFSDGTGIAGSGSYNRLVGLGGDGATTYVDTGIDNASNAQLGNTPNGRHFFAYTTQGVNNGGQVLGGSPPPRPRSTGVTGMSFVGGAIPPPISGYPVMYFGDPNNGTSIQGTQAFILNDGGFGMNNLGIVFANSNAIGPSGSQTVPNQSQSISYSPATGGYGSGNLRLMGGGSLPDNATYANYTIGFYSLGTAFPTTNTYGINYPNNTDALCVFNGIISTLISTIKANG